MPSSPLPEPLTHGPWSVTTAYRWGVQPTRLRGADLARPFHGVRSPSPPVDMEQLCRAYFTRQRPGQLVGGASAAALLGLPVPARLLDGDETTARNGRPLEIIVASNRSRPRTAGVHARRVRPDLLESIDVNGIPCASPALIALSVANRVSRMELVILLDAMLTASDSYPGIRHGRPLVTREALDAFAIGAGIATGGRQLRDALERAREGVESPQESRLRQLLVDADLPEPAVNLVVRTRDGKFIARLDLAYAAERIGIEYEGQHHLTDRRQWNRDIARVRSLEDAGWRIIRVVANDLSPNPERLIHTIRSAYRSRTLGRA